MIKVVIADYSDNTAPFWNAFATKYEATTGIKMDLQIIDWNDLDQQSSTMIQTGDLPGILNLNAYASYAADGLLYNSDEVLDPAVQADIIPPFVKSGTYNGKFYGTPDLSSARRRLRASSPSGSSTTVAPSRQTARGRSTRPRTSRRHSS